MNVDEQLFNSFKQISEEINLTAGVFQNNYDRLIEDGFITQSDITNSHSELNKRMKKHISELNSLWDISLDRLQEVISKKAICDTFNTGTANIETK